MRSCFWFNFNPFPEQNASPAIMHGTPIEGYSTATLPWAEIVYQLNYVKFYYFYFYGLKTLCFFLF